MFVFAVGVSSRLLMNCWEGAGS